MTIEITYQQTSNNYTSYYTLEPITFTFTREEQPEEPRVIEGTAQVLPLANEEDIMLELFYALLSEERRNLLMRLLNSTESLSVRDLTNSKLHQSTVQEHVNALYQANLITGTKIGNTTKYEPVHREYIKTLLSAAKAISK